MSDTEADDGLGLIGLSSEIVSSYVSHNSVSVADMPRLIADVHQALRDLSVPATPEAGPVPMPAVSVRKSITPEFIICLDDGKKFKSMKRHLSQLGMTPDEYRLKWGLPHDYPMVAPNYSATRSAMAKRIGLGQKPAQPEPKRGRAKAKV